VLASAGRVDPANSGRNIGMVNGLGYAGIIAGPAAITVLVEAAGLRWLPLLPCALMLVLTSAAPLLMRAAPRYRNTSQGATSDAVPEERELAIKA